MLIWDRHISTDTHTFTHISQCYLRITAMAPPLIVVPIFFPPVTWQTQTSSPNTHRNSYYMKSSHFSSRCSSAACWRAELAQGHYQKRSVAWHLHFFSNQLFPWRLSLSALSRIREPGPGEWNGLRNWERWCSIPGSRLLDAFWDVAISEIFKVLGARKSWFTSS